MALGDRERGKGPRKGLLALAIPTDEGDDREESDSEDTSQEDLEMAADDLIAAVEEKDPVAVAGALREAFRCCREERE